MYKNHALINKISTILTHLFSFMLKILFTDIKHNDFHYFFIIVFTKCMHIFIFRLLIKFLTPNNGKKLDQISIAS